MKNFHQKWIKLQMKQFSNNILTQPTQNITNRILEVLQHWMKKEIQIQVIYII